MNTELLIDAALIILAVLYFAVGVHWWRSERQRNREHARYIAEIEKSSARARQLRELVESRFWS